MHTSPVALTQNEISRNKVVVMEITTREIAYLMQITYTNYMINYNLFLI